jgi:hypothetical protein
LSWDWDEMLEAFRALGGVADNVKMGRGPYGRGLFPIDQDQPARIEVPTNLLIKMDDVEFVDGQLKIKAGAAVGEGEKVFFERFERDYSWGDGGRAECEAFLAEVDALPAPVREYLISELSFQNFLNILDKEEGVKRAGARFLSTRVIRWDGHMVLMPVLELVNHHTDAAAFGMKGGISVGGVFPGEMLVKYTLIDPFGAYLGWGFPTPETIAFSLPMRLTLPNHTLAVGRDLTQKATKGRFRVPTLTVEGKKATLSHLMIGAKKFPKLSKGFFYDVIKDLGVKDREALFDSVMHHNRSKYLGLLEVLDDHEGVLIGHLRRMARYQLEAMSYCIGSRDL